MRITLATTGTQAKSLSKQSATELQHVCQHCANYCALQSVRNFKTVAQAHTF